MVFTQMIEHIDGFAQVRGTQVRVAQGHFELPMPEDVRDGPQGNVRHRQLRADIMSKVMKGQVLDAEPFAEAGEGARQDERLAAREHRRG